MHLPSEQANSFRLHRCLPAIALATILGNYRELPVGKHHNAFGGSRVKLGSFLML
jgi:hypothetical protein